MHHKIKTYSLTYDLSLEVREDKKGNFYLQFHITSLGTDDTEHMYAEIWPDDFPLLAENVGAAINLANEKQTKKDIYGEPLEPIIIALTKEWTSKYTDFSFSVWRVDHDTLKLRVEHRKTEYHRHCFIVDTPDGYEHARTEALTNLTGPLYLNWQYQNLTDEH